MPFKKIECFSTYQWQQLCGPIFPPSTSAAPTEATQGALVLPSAPRMAEEADRQQGIVFFCLRSNKLITLYIMILMIAGRHADLSWWCGNILVALLSYQHQPLILKFNQPFKQQQICNVFKFI